MRGLAPLSSRGDCSMPGTSDPGQGSGNSWEVGPCVTSACVPTRPARPAGRPCPPSSRRYPQAPDVRNGGTLRCTHEHRRPTKHDGSPRLHVRHDAGPSRRGLRRNAATHAPSQATLVAVHERSSDRHLLRGFHHFWSRLRTRRCSHGPHGRVPHLGGRRRGLHLLRDGHHGRQPCALPWRTVVVDRRTHAATWHPRRPQSLVDGAPLDRNRELCRHVRPRHHPVDRCLRKPGGARVDGLILRHDRGDVLCCDPCGHCRRISRRHAAARHSRQCQRAASPPVRDAARAEADRAPWRPGPTERD